jgi:hypothetical protein
MTKEPSRFLTERSIANGETGAPVMTDEPRSGIDGGLPPRPEREHGSPAPLHGPPRCTLNIERRIPIA